MLQIRKSEDRGREDLGWLKTKYSFSFASYYDPKMMGFKSLRVINQDIVSEQSGFPTHPHKNMEIITIILRGTIEHRDSMGNATQIKAGEVQRMTAGTGVRHSEFNPSDSEPLELLQIWLLPEKSGLEPDYEQKRFSPDQYTDTLKNIISPKGQGDSLKINQDVLIYRSHLTAQKTIDYSLNKNRGAWVQVISGQLLVNGELLIDGDGLAAQDINHLKFTSQENADFLLFDLA